MSPRRGRREEPEPSAAPPRAPDAVTPPDSTYLDLDGDGLPDAVKTSRTLGYDVTGDGVADVVETVDEVASEIDDAGAPHRVEVTDTVEADLHGDGAFEVVDVVSVQAERSADLGAQRPDPRRRRPRAGRSALRRVRERIRARRAPGFAATRVSPDTALQALQHVTACSSPQGDIRVSIDKDAVGFAVHFPHAGWWAATAVRARLRRGSPTALTVDRGDLQTALLAAAETHRKGAPVIVRRGEALWVGDTEVSSVAAVERVVSAPPSFESWEPLAEEVVVPTVDDLEGETTFPFAHGTITTSNSFLGSLAVWGVERVELFEGAGRVFLLGASNEQHAFNRIVVTGEARLNYV